MGTVWRAVDELVGREIAVKEPRLPGDPHDAAYDDDSMTTPIRCLQLMIITADQEFYELRVDMPKGTAAEKKGTELFKGVRARLKVGEDSVKS
ncbi:hypothetical protein [Streptomyces flavofungini]|uniref:Uncharacterized protein n=1 Tax=Streptomyces flavofungini TaxID=68200 RepID=A0ABS0X5N2_9ACTN|nr:hypothetical protein [Streptomyces flavofungini]MBJ3808499.1 hypothetical protein [Streptomyces flavofungini]